MELLKMWGILKILLLKLGEVFIAIKQKLSSIKVINNSKAGQQSASLYTEGAERNFLRPYYQKKRRQFTEDSLSSHHNMLKNKMCGAIKAVCLDASDSVVAVGLLNQTDSFSKLCGPTRDKVQSVVERSVGSTVSM
jgi:hypothetical protein